MIDKWEIKEIFLKKNEKNLKFFSEKKSVCFLIYKPNILLKNV